MVKAVEGPAWRGSEPPPPPPTVSLVTPTHSNIRVADGVPGAHSEPAAPALVTNTSACVSRWSDGDEGIMVADDDNAPG